MCRSSFGSELLATCGAADGMQAFLLTLHGMQHGPASASETRQLRECGGYAAASELVVDGMSVFSALLMDPVRDVDGGSPMVACRPASHQAAGRSRFFSVCSTYLLATAA